MFFQTSRASALLIITLLTCGHSSSPIPKAISSDEYAVYAAWLTSNFKKRPERLLVSNRTFAFDPMGTAACKAQFIKAEPHINTALLKTLHDIGDAEYPLRKEFFKLPWNYEMAEERMADPLPPFQLISFSRVAFNRDRTLAFFAVNNSCGGLCGGEGALLATRTNKGWTFSPYLGCVSIN